MNKSKRRESAFTAFRDPTRVREEIACIETRLAEIGPDGDCAYENAMIRQFEKQVEMRRVWLESEIRAAHH